MHTNSYWNQRFHISERDNIDLWLAKCWTLLKSHCEYWNFCLMCYYTNPLALWQLLFWLMRIILPNFPWIHYCFYSYWTVTIFALAWSFLNKSSGQLYCKTKTGSRISGRRFEGFSLGTIFWMDIFWLRYQARLRFIWPSGAKADVLWCPKEQG